MAATIGVPVVCAYCGVPFRVTVLVRIVAAGRPGAQVEVDQDHLALAVRVHARQHA